LSLISSPQSVDNYRKQLIELKGKLTSENSFFYPRIDYSSATSITRTKVIFHNTNVFINLVKVIQRVQDGRRENYYSTNEKLNLFIWVMSLYI
jgi:hypothetical protein